MGEKLEAGALCSAHRELELFIYGIDFEGIMKIMG